MKKLLIALLALFFLFSCDPSGGTDPLTDSPTTDPTTDTPIINTPTGTDPTAPTGDTAPVKTAIPIPAGYEGVVTGAWILREGTTLSMMPKALIASADPLAKFCTEVGSFYVFYEDGRLLQLETKQEEWNTMAQACRTAKEVYEYSGKGFDYIAVPRYIPPYIPANPEPIPPTLHIYVVDKDNSLVTDYDVAAIEPGDPVGYYNTILSTLIANILAIKDYDFPDAAPHRWLGGGTKTITITE